MMRQQLGRSLFKRAQQRFTTPFFTPSSSVRSVNLKAPVARSEADEGLERDCKTGPFTAEERAFFEENGYLVRRGFVSEQVCGKLEQRIYDIIEQDFDPASSSSVFTSHDDKRDYADDYFLTSGDKVRFFWEEDAFDNEGKLQYPVRDSINKVGHALHTEDPVFRQYVFEQLSGIAFSLLPAPTALQSMYICKSQRTGGEITPHQDSTFLYTDPPSCHGLWLSVHAADEGNGCLWIVPGSHNTPIHQRFVRTYPNADEAGRDGDGDAEKGADKDKDKVVLAMEEFGSSEELSKEGGIPVPTNVGDLVILHGE